jgi:hypothetical protein
MSIALMHLLSITPLLLFHYPQGEQVTWLFIICMIILLVCLIPAIFYLLTLQNILKAISHQNRAMRPGQVWLLLIPFFGLAWHFIVVSNISTSIEQEYKSKGIAVENRPTYNIGLVMCILLGCSSLIFFFFFLRSLISIAALICWIIYWVKVNEYKNKIQALPAANTRPEDNGSRFFTTLK